MASTSHDTPNRQQYFTKPINPDNYEQESTFQTGRPGDVHDELAFFSDVDNCDKPSHVVNNFQKSSHDVVIVISYS